MTVRIGMAGAGRMSKLHAGCLKDFPEAEIVGVADEVQERASSLAKEVGAKAYGDYVAMLDREALDAVYICTPTGLHAEQAIAAAERGIPFFVEKPLALDMSLAWQVACAVERYNVISCVGYHWRYTEAVAKAKQLLGARPVALTSAEWLWTVPPIPWFRDRNLSGGQVVDQTTHLTDLCQLFAGPVTEVYAAYTLNTFADSEFHNWDGYSLTFKHAGGAVGSLHCTYALFPAIGDLVPPYVEIVARDLYLRISPQGLTTITPEGTQEYRNQGVFHSNLDRAFVSAVAQGNASLICSSVPETLRSLALTLAATESAQKCQVVNLDRFMQNGRS